MARAAAKGSSSRRGRAAEKDRGSRTPLLIAAGSEIAGLVLIGLALLSTLALATYAPEDPVGALVEVRNAGGPAGATLAGWLLRSTGGASVVWVAAGAFVGGRLLLGLGLPGLWSRFWIGIALLIPALAALPPLLFELAPERVPWVEPGWLGIRLVRFETLVFGRLGALVLSSTVLVVGGLSLAGISAGAMLRATGAGLRLVSGLVALAVVWRWDRACRIGRGVGSASSRAARGAWMVVRRAPGHARESLARLHVWREQRLRRSKRRQMLETELALGPSEQTPPAAAGSGPELVPAASSGPAAGRRGQAGEEPDIVDHDQERRKTRKPEQEAFRFDDSSHSGPFELPDISIFAAPPEGERSFDRDSLIMNSKILEKKLADFGVTGRVVRVHPGPVITMYEYEPAPGIKVNRIVGLTDDLTMALRAISIRIIAPLPGKSVVGIEVPNPRRETVYLREMLESESFRKSDSPLAVAMGKDIFGNAVASDLARMPHLLVAGSTGTGKSVFLNSFLCSLLCRATPNQLKLLLIDPKMLELSIYDGIPHLIADVVTSPKRASAALQGIVRKMEERYQMMSATQVRNIDQFNEKARRAIAAGEESFRLKSRPGQVEGDEIEWQELPFIVVVIDELADLMMSAAKDVEESLQRLAQMARASGIHLVLATQRPSVDVLTGVIKANFPARVSFQVSSGTDSRTILDQKGADDLLGMGDMLFLPPGTAVLQRIHGPFVTETEVHALVSSLRAQGRPVFDEDLVRADTEAAKVESGGEEVDEMFDQAVAIVAETRNASISYVQRRLKIGYNRAARIIEQMENDGMIGPQIGAKGREVLLPAPGVEGE